jgi:hypothetical protein
MIAFCEGSKSQDVKNSVMLTVIIPTCNRPQFLRDALESVRQQSSLGRIGQVIVSENRGGRESKNVCEEFPGLPICYLYQEPAVSFLLHLREILPHVRSPLVAFLHDDDYWAPPHLTDSLSVLDSDPECAAVFSNHFWTDGPKYPARVAYSWAWQVWVASGCDFSRPVLKLEDESVVLAGLLGPAFHYSTMVARKDAFREACRQLLASGNEFDNDRTFPIFLTAHGRVAYLPRPDVFVRFHQGQDHRQYAETRDARMLQTTRWMIEKWPDKVAGAARRFNSTKSNLPRAYLDDVTQYIVPSLRDLLIAECGLKLPVPAEPTSARPRDWRWFLNEICPPAVFGIRRLVRRRFASAQRRVQKG